MKKLMILGAGIYQVPLIKKAKQLGLYTIVCSIRGNYPGFAVADKIYYVNTTDKEAILEIAKAEQIEGICTTGTDVAVITIGYVCEQMNLPGITFDAACIATNKAYMKQCYVNNDVSTAPFFVVQSAEEAVEAFEKLKKPVLMKIVDKSGSRGIYKVEKRESVAEIFVDELTRTNLPYIVMEEFVDGHEIGIDALVQNGEVKLLMLHDKLMFQGQNTTIPIGHIMPFEACSTIIKKLEEVARKAITAMKLDDCAVNMDVFLTADEEVYMIETGGRAGATGIPEVISGYSGIDYYEQIINLALGREIQIKSTQKKPCASVLLRAPESGILKNVIFPKVTHAEFSLDYEFGNKVFEMKNGTDRIGQTIVCAESVSELKDKIEQILNEIVIEVINDGI